MLASLTRHRTLLVFLAKMLAFYAAWYVVYDLWLLPDGRLDDVVARNAAWLSGGLLHLFGFDAVVDGRVVVMASGKGVLVADDCTGLATIGLFLGFVLAFPGRWVRRALFIPAGIALIHLANVGRIAFLAWFYDAYPGFFDAVHEWGVLPFFYAVVFVLWMAWVRVGAERDVPQSDVAVQPVAG
jgi:exosortase family protein XrtF